MKKMVNDLINKLQFKIDMAKYGLTIENADPCFTKVCESMIETLEYIIDYLRPIVYEVDLEFTDTLSRCNEAEN